VGKFFEKAGTDFGAATLWLRRKAAEEPCRVTLCCCSASSRLLWLVAYALVGGRDRCARDCCFARV